MSDRSSLTEETPNAPGWADSRIDEVFAGLKLNDAGVAAREAYADCLAGCRGAVDVDAGHDGCRRTLLAALEAAGADLEGLERRLMALEAEISAGT